MMTFNSSFNSFPWLPLVFMLGVVAFSVTQILDLMHRGDKEFPGRLDKLTWAIVIVGLPGAGALAFWIWKPAAIPESSEALKGDLANQLAELKAHRADSTNDSGKLS